MVAGFALAPAEGWTHTGLAASIRDRLPIRAAKIELAGAPAVAGTWIADAAPRFDPATGGFTGYCGRMRRLDDARRAAPVPTGDSEADRVRQLLHELRTPVNAIQGFAEVIQQQVFGPAPHEYRALAAAIASDAARILAGFAELERLARIEAGAHDGEAGACDLAAVLVAVDAQLTPFTSGRDSGFTLELGADPLAVAVPQAEAEQLAWRLMATLAGAAHPGEVTRIEAWREDGAVHVRLHLPAALAAVVGDGTIRAPGRAAAPQPAQTLNAGMFGTGFTMRLAKAEARAAGGWLERRGEALQLCLPGLTGEMANS